MKTHFSLLLFGSFAAISQMSHAAVFIADFSGLAGNDPLVPNAGPAYGGWSQSELNGVDSGDEYPLAYGHSIETAPGVAVGAYNSIPENDTFYIEHAVGGALVGTTMTLTFALDHIDISPDDNPRNTFEIGAYTSGGDNLFSFVAEATVDPTQWNVLYRIGAAGSNISISNAHSIALGQITDMTVTFAASGADAIFNISLSDGTTTFGISDTMTGMADADFDAFRVSMLKVPGTTPPDFDSYGTNFIAIADLQIIPEPGSAALLGLAAGVLMLRRWRS
jgi:hypothetical protein